MTASAFMEELKTRVAEHPFLRHPFLQLISTQQVSREQAKRFALLYYPHILRTRLYQANALGVTPDERVQGVLARILYDEYGNGDLSRSHMEVYRKLLRALDATPEEIANPPLIPEQQGYIDTMMRVTQGADWLAAVGVAGIAGEWPIPPYYRMLLKGFRTVPGLTDDDLELVIGHIELDVEHSRIVEEVLAPYVETEDGRASLWRGIKLNLDARLVQLSGIQREVFGTPY